MLKVSSLNDDDGAAADPLAGMNRKEREAMVLVTNIKHKIKLII